MTPSDATAAEKKESRTVIIVAAVIAALVIAGLIGVLMWATGGGVPPPRLEGALRPGSAEFEQYRTQIIMDEPEATQANRALGDIVMTLKTTVRNLSNKTLSGLEVRGTVVDHQNQPVKQRTVIVIPSRAPGGLAELPPSKTVDAIVTLDGMTERDDRANIKMEIIGIKFKN